MDHEYLNTLTDREAAALLPDYFNGSLSEEDKRKIDEWKSDSEENNRKFHAMLEIIMDFRALDSVSGIDVETALSHVNGRISKKRRSWLRHIERAAAILFIPLMAATILSITRTSTPSPTYHQLKVGTGMTGYVTLPDSSTVILNSGSTLRYPSEFTDGSRTIELVGEAYFDVRKDSDRKFSVMLADGSSVNVYGTRFNVDAYPDDNAVITLAQGAVGYNYTDNKGTVREIRLSPDQQVIKTAEGYVSLINTEASKAIGWKDNKIILENTSLNSILKSLEKRFDVDFVIQDREIEELTFSGNTISINSLDYVLETLNIATGMNWRYVNSPTDERRTIELSYPR